MSHREINRARCTGGEGQCVTVMAAAVWVVGLPAWLVWALPSLTRSLSAIVCLADIIFTAAKSLLMTAAAWPG